LELIQLTLLELFNNAFEGGEHDNLLDNKSHFSEFFAQAPPPAPVRGSFKLFLFHFFAFF
jgi:hypothetical protein